ncbi:MAG: putative membrane protein [Verrucomicrobiales bacterium]|jgi:putative membrane protein
MQTAEIAIRYLHFVSIFAVIATITAEHLLLARKMPRLQLRRVSQLDTIYGVAAILVLITGILQWVTVGKDSSFYSKNWIFLVKIAAFILVGLISIYPTVFFAKGGKGPTDEIVEVPKSIFMVVRIELLLLISIPLLAVLMARGIGLRIE